MGVWDYRTTRAGQPALAPNMPSAHACLTFNVHEKSLSVLIGCMQGSTKRILAEEGPCLARRHSTDILRHAARVPSNRHHLFRWRGYINTRW